MIAIENQKLVANNANLHCPLKGHPCHHRHLWNLCRRSKIQATLREERGVIKGPATTVCQTKIDPPIRAHELLNRRTIKICYDIKTKTSRKENGSHHSTSSPSSSGSSLSDRPHHRHHHHHHHHHHHRLHRRNHLQGHPQVTPQSCRLLHKPTGIEMQWIANPMWTESEGPFLSRRKGGVLTKGFSGSRSLNHVFPGRDELDSVHLTLIITNYLWTSLYLTSLQWIRMMIVAAAGTIITINTTTVRRMIVMRVYNESEIIRNNAFNPNRNP